jgi:parallel beta-helix repeat protein
MTITQGLRRSDSLICGLILLSGVFFSAKVSAAATYFVAKTGNDANPCTQASPCSSIAKGLSKLSAGDTLQIGAGTYAENISGDNIPSGTSWSNTTKIKGAGMQGGTILHLASSHGLSFFGNKQYIELSDFEIDKSGSSSSTNGITFDGPQRFIRLRNLNVHHMSNQGVYTGTQASDLEFVNLDVHHAGRPTCSFKAGGYCHSFYLQGSLRILIDGGRMHDNDGLGVQCYCTNLTVKNTLVYNNAGYAGIFGSDATNARVFNNTVYGNSNNGIAINGSGVQVRNNIVYQNDTNLSLGSVAQSNNLTADPKFINTAGANFRLHASSPAINAGVTLAEVATDAEGTRRPQGPAYDIGAYEFVSTPIPLSPPN